MGPPPPLTSTTVIDALLADKACPLSLNNFFYLLRYPTLAVYEQLESFVLLVASSTLTNVSLTPAALSAFVLINPAVALPTLAILAFSLRNGIMPLAKAAITLASFGWAGDKLAQSPMIVDFINTHGTTLTVLAKILPISTELKTFYDCKAVFDKKTHPTPKDHQALNAAMVAMIVKIAPNLYRLANTSAFRTLMSILPGIPRDATMTGGQTITCYANFETQMAHQPHVAPMKPCILSQELDKML